MNQLGKSMNDQRSSGVILHPSALPGNHGIGELGAEAKLFIDWLVEAEQRYWQVLPMGPTDSDMCPFASISNFAGNSLLISIDSLIRDGLLSEADVCKQNAFNVRRVDYREVFTYKNGLLKTAFRNFSTNTEGKANEEFIAFCSKERDWLEPYSVFSALAETNGKDWSRWNADIRFYQSRGIMAAKEIFNNDITFHSFCQYLFFKQWYEIKRYANDRGVSIIGDVPIYTGRMSADTWSNADVFDIDPVTGDQLGFGGAAPDMYFGEDGQFWGNPLYNWERLAETDYLWWRKRFAHALKMYDQIRLDHFRGFESYWVIPTENTPPKNGFWRKGGGEPFFRSIERHLGKLPFIAEDLGFITHEVSALKKAIAICGMSVTQFGFGTDIEDNPYYPHLVDRETVVYTSSHDTDTTRGWFDSLSKEKIAFLELYLNKKISKEEIHWDILRLAMSTNAKMTVTLLQDIFGLDSAARFNEPGTVKPTNWSWRFTREMLHDKSVIEQLRRLTRMFHRSPQHFTRSP
jgi:4-alpha-glucanotransferase